jgi:hypothetical protein
MLWSSQVFVLFFNQNCGNLSFKFWSRTFILVCGVNVFILIKHASLFRVQSEKYFKKLVTFILGMV